MKITVDRTTLIAALDHAKRATTPTPAMPIYEHVALAVENNDTLIIAASDMVLSTALTIPAEVQALGGVALPARDLIAAVKQLPDGEASITTDRDQWTIIEAGRVRYRLAGLPIDDVPEMPELDEPHRVSVDAARLSRMLERTTYAVSRDDGRPHLASALVEAADGRLTIIATDGHRMALDELHEDLGVWSLLVPLRMIGEVERLARGEGSVALEWDSARVTARRVVQTGDVDAAVRVTSGVTDAKFPPAKRVIPKSSEHEVTVDRDQLVRAIRAAAVIERAAVRMVVRDGSVSVNAASPERGEAGATIDADADVSLDIGVHPAYLLDAVSGCDEGEITLALNGPTDAIAISDGSHYLAVVMPMRL